MFITLRVIGKIDQSRAVIAGDATYTFRQVVRYLYSSLNRGLDGELAKFNERCTFRSPEPRLSHNGYSQERTIVRDIQHVRILAATINIPPAVARCLV